MAAKSPSLVLGAVLLTLAAGHAQAACGDRPGTPRITGFVQDQARPYSALHLTFIPSVGCKVLLGCETHYWDVSIREGSPAGASIGRDMTGVGPAARDSKTPFTFRFNDLKRSTTYCVQMRARTAPGSEGCVSAKWTNWSCKATARTANDCGAYAQNALNTRRLARNNKCDPKVISGGRWSPSFEHHRRWCNGADPKVADFEERERLRIAQQCRT